MKFVSRVIISAVMLIGSASALATQKLTAQECNDYPFESVTGQVTKAQLERELSELESVGYQPGPADDDSYPETSPDLQQAEKLLQAKYVADCAPAAHRANAHMPSDGGKASGTMEPPAN
jgi:Domain of unknown function (DUF4148)